jgi:hypothetical protein
LRVLRELLRRERPCSNWLCESWVCVAANTADLAAALLSLWAVSAWGGKEEDEEGEKVCVRGGEKEGGG